MARFFDLRFSEHYVFDMLFYKGMWHETSYLFIIGNCFVEEVTIINQNIFDIVQGFTCDFDEVICVKS